MRGLMAAALVAVFAGPAAAQAPGTPTVPPGMENYVFGLLYRGPASTSEQTPETKKIQEGHMANINRMADLGALVAAGPIEGTGDLRGIFVFKGTTVDQARALAAEDPAIKAGRLTLQLHRWMGPAGIGARFAAEKKSDPAFKVKMRTYQLGLLKAVPGAAEGGADAQKAHLQHIAAIQAAGKLAGVGPILDEGDLRGIYIFNTEATEAKRLASEDPPVKAGRLAVELHTWWCAEKVMPDKLPPIPVPK